MQMSFIRSVGLDEKIIDILWTIERSLIFCGLLVIQETPRNKRFGGDRGRFSFLNIYPEMFAIITAFFTCASKVQHFGMKYPLLLGQMCRCYVFGMISCLQIRNPVFQAKEFPSPLQPL